MANNVATIVWNYKTQTHVVNPEKLTEGFLRANMISMQVKFVDDIVRHGRFLGGTFRRLRRLSTSKDFAEVPSDVLEKSLPEPIEVPIQKADENDENEDDEAEEEHDAEEEPEISRPSTTLSAI